MLDRRNADGTRTMTWRQDQPSATYLVSLIVAPLVKIRDAWRGIPVDYYVYPEDSARRGGCSSVTPDMIDVYSRSTGVRYPWAKYAQTTVADFFGGMENVSATTLVDWLPDAPRLRGPALVPLDPHPPRAGPPVVRRLRHHGELGQHVAERGLRRVHAGPVLGDPKLGRHAEDDYYLDEYEQFMQIDARRRMPLAALGSNNIYPKGALVLRMLERLPRPGALLGLDPPLPHRPRLGTATTDDLRQAVLEATGENLDWFWDEWMYQAGYPEFTVTATYDSARRASRCRCRQTQPDTAKADSTGLRFTTPAVFRMPLTIRVGTSAGDVVQRVELNQREQSIVVDGVKSAPTMVIFDDGNAVLKKLTFDQPTAWLATQLERDPDLWNRHWAIERLAERRTDSHGRGGPRSGGGLG